MSVEAAIARAQALGLRVNNLFQLEDEPLWQANVCRGREAYAFSRAGTPAAALNAAIDDYEKMVTAVRRPSPPSQKVEASAVEEDVFA
jgi:hypothetical protein